MLTAEVILFIPGIQEQILITPVIMLKCLDLLDQLNHLILKLGAKLHAKKHGYDVFPVRSLEFQDTINRVYGERKDDWSSAVLSRLSLALDLPAAEAVYHQACNVNFRTGRQMPRYFQDNNESLNKYVH